MVSLLLAKEGIDVNQADDDGGPHFLLASQNGQAECVSLLLAKEGISEPGHNDGATPLLVASDKGHTECVSPCCWTRKASR